MSTYTSNGQTVLSTYGYITLPASTITVTTTTTTLSSTVSVSVSVSYVYATLTVTAQGSSTSHSSTCRTAQTHYAQASKRSVLMPRGVVEIGGLEGVRVGGMGAAGVVWKRGV